MSVKVKICGINSIESMVASKGADYIGLVFYPKSPRFVNAEQAKEIIKYSDSNQKIVGLFVDTQDSVIEYIAEYVGLDYLQFHGNEDYKKINYFKKKLQIPIIKSISVSSHKDTQKFEDYKNICDMILFDSFPNNNILPGGSGEKFNWNFLKNFKCMDDWMLAGGINKDNLKEALRLTNAPIVDVSSGLETRKGFKSPKKIKEFLKLAKSLSL